MSCLRLLNTTRKLTSKSCYLQPIWKISFSTENNVPLKNVINKYSKVSIIGTGKMAEALIDPLISSDIQSSKSIFVYDKSHAAMNNAHDKYGVNKTSSISECIDGTDLIVMAVKPQNSDLVCHEIQSAMRAARNNDPTILSIIAGKTINSFVDGCGGLVTKVVRSMPNTPSQIGAGISVWTCTPNINAEEKLKIKTILSSFGKEIFVEDENFVDMSTSISGSGPAYIFLLMESMIDAGVHLGFSRDVATTLVHHTLLGSTLYAMDTKEHPAILRNSVTSPAGTTASAIYELENGKFTTVVKNAVWACYRRSLEMGGECSNIGPGRRKTQIGPNHDIPMTNMPQGECVDESDSDDEKK